MHPSYAAPEVDTTQRRANSGTAKTATTITGTSPQETAGNGTATTIITPPTPTTNGRENGLKLTNGDANGNAKPPHHGNVNGTGNGTGNLKNGNGNLNGLNGNGTGNGTGNGYQNDGRRDSAQMWTPLLATHGVDGNCNGNGNGNGHVNGDASTTVIYDDSGTNNNDWKDAEEINNLKNGLLHHPGHTHPHPHHQGGNNNGSLLNGKNGNGLGLGLALGLPDKYDEQDPLTGLYTTKRLRASESEESEFDSDLSRGGRAQKTPTCGLFGCRPKWARGFASTHVFMVVFLLAYILQGMYMTYFVSVITTIEKLFQIKSKTTGLLLSASEMGQISTAMLLTYFAGRGHRPRWIACGMVLFSVAAFACSLPHFIFGDQLMQSSALLHARPGPPTGAAASFGLEVDVLALNATHGPQEALGLGSLAAAIGSHDLNLCLANGNGSAASGSECNEDQKLEQASHSKITVIVLCIFFASLLSSGIGQTAVATLGIPYIDDNVASKQSPMYMAITIGVRILGPASGFIVGSFCTRWYVNFSNPGYDASDPRWIGAWWLGPVVIGSLMMLSSIAMFSFPKELRGRRVPTAAGDKDQGPQEPEEKPKLKDFPKTVRRQLSNDILMFRTASCVFHLLPIAGLYTFLPKYLETQFRVATYDANMIAAFCGILVMGVGIVISGIVILKLKPSAKSVAAWIAFTALVYSAGMVILMFVGCNMNDFAGYRPSTASTRASIEPACSAALNCTCDRENFAPICGVDGRMYISTCHAGCAISELRPGDNRTVFSNCACIPESTTPNGDPYEAVSGYCDNQCKNFIFFILIFAVCVFMHSTSEVGSMLLVMRCTHPKDKAMAMGVIQSAIGLFGNVPCPIIYGAVVDSACLIWKTVCSKHGACSLYDADTFRHYFLGITAGIMFLAFIMDLVVWSKAHRIDIAPEDGDVKSAETEGKKAMAPPDTTV